MKLRAVALGLAVCAACMNAANAADPKPGSGGDSEWVSLFNGKDLTGWKVGDAKQSKIHVEDGMIVAAGPRAHIFTEAEFKNFEFEAEVKTTPGSNSGLYFHAKYQETGFPDSGFETQVNVSQRDPVKTGSLYNLVKLYETPAKDNEFWKQRIVVREKNVRVFVNDKLVLDYTEPDGVKGPKNKIGRGSFAIQAHDPMSTTYYRNLRVKRLAD